MKIKNVVFRTLTILSSALMVLPMVLPWITSTATAGKIETTNSELIYDLTKDFIDASKSGGLMTLAQVLFYIVFSLAMVLVVLEVARFFLKANKAVDLAALIVTISVLVLGINTFVFSLAWCVTNSSSTTIAGVTAGVKYVPWFGGIGTLILGVAVGIFGLIDFTTKSKSKGRKK